MGLFTLCSGHRTEKFSSFSRQPEETHTHPHVHSQDRDQDNNASGTLMFQIQRCVRHLTGWHICSENSWRSLSGNSPLLHPSAGTWSTPEQITLDKKKGTSITEQQYCKCLTKQFIEINIIPASSFIWNQNQKHVYCQVGLRVARNLLVGFLEESRTKQGQQLYE